MLQTCYNCGKEVSDQTLICPECGALVRRYNDIPTRTDASREQPIMQPIAVAPKKGKLRFRGAIKIWLIIMIALSSYMLVSSLASIYLGSNGDFFREVFSEPGAEDLAEQLEPILTFAQEELGLFWAMAFLFSCKLGCHIWLLCSRRKLAFYLSIGVSIAALIGIGILGGGLFGFVYFLDPLITWLNLRPYWPYMEN